jgi:protein phosphatase 1L
VCDNLFANLIKSELFASNLVKAVADAYTETDGQYIELDAELQRDDGCTAVTAVLVGNRLVVAHCGDSRFVAGAGTGWLCTGQGHNTCSM